MAGRPIYSYRQSFTTSDGTDLSYVIWHRGDVSRCKALLLVLHGIGFHSEPYKVVAEGISAPGIVFAGLDFRGHGRSGGDRGRMPPLVRMLDDIREWVDHMRSTFPGVPVFLLAESMAGPFAALHAAQCRHALDGLILVAPAVLLSWQQVWHPETLNGVAVLLRRPVNPVFEITISRLPEVFREEEFVTTRLEDPLRLREVSGDYLVKVGYAMARVVFEPKLKADLPVLIVHGESDNIVSPLGARLLHWRFKSPDKHLAIIPNGHHTLMWDYSSSRTFTLIEGWLAEHTGDDLRGRVNGVGRPIRPQGA